MAKCPRFVHIAVVLCATLFLSCTADFVIGGKGNDIANYRTVKIGSQVWMAENLNYNITGSKCYDNDEANCEIYGRLYNWATAMSLPSNCNSSSCSSQIGAKRKGICPKGWHIPNDNEWTMLINFVGENAGTQLKAINGWNSYNEIPSGTNTYDFTALPGGWGDSDGNFNSIGNGGYWWSSTESSDNYASYTGMYYGNETVNWGNGKSYFHSVRCLQD